jgi:hypothetical protein
VSCMSTSTEHLRSRGGISFRFFAEFFPKGEREKKP